MAGDATDQADPLLLTKYITRRKDQMITNE